MSQFTAGETITVTLEGKTLTLKIEDASKSESISARIEHSDSEHYPVGSIHPQRADHRVTKLLSFSRIRP